MSAEQQGQDGEQILRTASGHELFGLFDRLTRALPWRPQMRPFPVIVLEPGDDRTDEQAFMDALRHAATRMRLPALHLRPGRDGDGGEQDGSDACALLERMARDLPWLGAATRAGRFRFPRSDLVRSLEEAVGTARGDGSAARPPDLRAAALEAWNARAGLFQDGPRSLPAWWPAAGAALVATLGGLVGGFAEQTNWTALLAAVGSLCAVLLVVTALFSRRIWLPVASRVGFGSRYRWLATSSFFTILGDGSDGLRGRPGVERCLYEVFGRLTAPDADEFLLQMKTLAFLEDLRAGYRRLSPALRGFKRPAPPVLFLEKVTAGNGGIALLSAMSDIRSRRSELHPLLVVASADAGHRDQIPGPAEPRERGDAVERYEQWQAALGTSQGPSRHVPLPWLLRLPVVDGPRTEPAPRTRPRRRPRWTWAWSWRGLLVYVVAFIVVTSLVHAELRSRYCSVGLPFSWNADTRLHTNADGTRECVGVATRGVRFERNGRSIGLDGELHDPGDRSRGPTLAGLQAMIDEENRRVIGGGLPYVTVLHAGVFTTRKDEYDLTVTSVKELAGAHLAQLRNNERQRPGQARNPLQIRLLPVNTGQDMTLSQAATAQILKIARKDPTVIGIVGMGRNTRPSQEAVRRLHAAGLPIISTVNSSNELPRLDHFHSLAATNREEVAASRAAFGGAAKGRTMIVSREPGPSGDAYSPEIAADAERVLPRPSQPVRYEGTGDIPGKVSRACASPGEPFTLVYFAGRAEDLWGLLEGLKTGGCTQRRLTLVAGDDVTKNRFGSGPGKIGLPESIEVYHTAFVHLPHLIARDQSRPFFQQARDRLGIGAPPLRGDDELLADGQMALAYDALGVLAQAAQQAFHDLGLDRPAAGRVPGGSAVTSGTVLTELPRVKLYDGATGNIDLTAAKPPAAGQGTRGLTLLRVTSSGGEVVSEPVCGRLGGGLPVPGLRPCPA
ncbi:hypothetical protein GCM10023085_21380 [Actinomadura viridis]|uniref:ABC-type branched-subunit amino acid transport system substrate-binding protein n=1 Tax=Actinomadura viridis TaxID=58110 RepID=A0A931DCD1_9ACTN|nr:ABC transporter substrate-binding protein [Actinomadura viridis]MBG6088514.1 hypothetical protein [Actinomadura viridis]